VSSESREGAGGTAGSMATSTHAVDNLRKDLELPSGGFSSTEHRRAPEEARGVGRKQMREREVASRGVPGFINRGGELGLWWVASDAIGWRWRCFWTVSCAESRHMGGGVGGILVWLGNGRFQSGFGRVQARWGHTWARGSRVTMASASVCRAVQVWVWGDAGAYSCMLERYAHSGRSGRLAGIGLARSGRVAW
jgi:hypothetical protein